MRQNRKCELIKVEGETKNNCIFFPKKFHDNKYKRSKYLVIY